MAHSLAAVRIILAAFSEIAGVEVDKEQAIVPAAKPADIQKRLDKAKRMYAVNIQHVRVQNKIESAAMLSDYNNLMTLYRHKCGVVDKHTRAAAQLKVNFQTFGSEIRAVIKDRDAKTQEIIYLRALVAK
ncbi:hypothetical protein GGH96_000015 [Coemansia sp. RSA 1972]|nr:hypothetical protein GGH96_000015 [Coemansia sp. RSA 1972]